MDLIKVAIWVTNMKMIGNLDLKKKPKQHFENMFGIDFRRQRNFCGLVWTLKHDAQTPKPHAKRVCKRLVYDLGWLHCTTTWQPCSASRVPRLHHWSRKNSSTSMHGASSLGSESRPSTRRSWMACVGRCSDSTSMRLWGTLARDQGNNAWSVLRDWGPKKATISAQSV